MISLEFKKAAKPTRRACAERMVEYGSIDSDFVVMEADIGKSTYSYLFAEKFPERYFQMGIAELNMMTAAAGMAAEGRTVFVAGYGVFLTMRAVESVRSFICYPNLNVKLFSSHGGITAAVDGVTHQSSEDISYMGTLPNMKILVPADTVAARACFDLAVRTPGPFYIRLMRDALFDIYGNDAKFSVPGSNLIAEGTDVTIVSYGDILFQAIDAAKKLLAEGIKAEVLDMYCVKPLDWPAVKKSAVKTGAVVVAENHQKRNGLGYDIGYHLLRDRVNVPFEILGLEDTFAETGDYFKLLEKYKLSADAIVNAALELMRKKK